MLFEKLSRKMVGLNTNIYRVTAKPNVDSTVNPFTVIRSSSSPKSHSQLQLKPRIHSDPFAIFPEQPRERTHRQRQESQQRVSPPETESLIHRSAGEWHQGAYKTADCGGSCRRGGFEKRVRVDEVCCYAHLDGR